MEVTITFIEESSKQQSTFSPLQSGTIMHSLIFEDYYFSENTTRRELTLIILRYVFYLNRGRGRTLTPATENKPAHLRKFEYVAAVHSSQVKRELRGGMAKMIADLLTTGHTKSTRIISSRIVATPGSYEHVSQYFYSAFYAGMSVSIKFA